MLTKVSILKIIIIKKSGAAKFASYVSMFGPFEGPHAWDLIFKK